MKRLTAWMVTLAMTLTFSACSGEPANTTAPTPTPAPVTPSAPTEVVNNEVIEYYMQKANEVVVSDTHVTFTDDSGRGEISIAKNPQKVAVLYGSLACLWHEAGGTVQVAIGGKSATTLYKEQIGRDFTQDEGVTVVSESSSGTAWDIEAIIATKPDLIICSTGMKGYENIGGPAEAANIPVIGINYDAVQDYLKWFKVFCNLNGQPQLWDSIADTTAQSIIDIVSSVPEKEKAPKAIILVLSSNVLKAYTGASQPGVILNELNGVNLVDPEHTKSAASIEISLEDIYALDPDLIFLSEFGSTSLETLDELYGDNPVWQALDAVKEGKLLSLPKGLFHNKANRNYSESYRYMANCLYPDYQF